VAARAPESPHEIAGMNSDPLLSNDLAALLRSFPNDALRDLVAVLKQHTSLSPFPTRRAYAAHALPVGGDFTAHATAIAEEVLWWGSHDVHRQFADAPGWIEVVTGTAKHLDVPEKERAPLFARPWMHGSVWAPPSERPR
jgi:hypothetical protein